MAQLKKVLMTMPDTLLEEIDSVAGSVGFNRSEFVREAVKYYIKEHRKRELTERMKKGYQLMAGINREYAELGLVADNQQLLDYEEKLSESE